VSFVQFFFEKETLSNRVENNKLEITDQKCKKLDSYMMIGGLLNFDYLGVILGQNVIATG
jgi:hypothetical protein